jgi:2,4-diketo-3-deoxy-L-fuconate hydrolase
VRFINIDERFHVSRTEGIFPLSLSDLEAPGCGPATFEQWSTFLSRAADQNESFNSAVNFPIGGTAVGPPVSQPRQVFAIGLNYRDHAHEAEMEIPTQPTVFTKFPSCIVGPNENIVIPTDYVDWEAELVVVIGQRASNIALENAWSVVAGLTAGQDITERRVQWRPPTSQFSLGKSYPTFGPIGPTLVTPDEFDNPNDLEITCTINGELVQNARTSDLIFSVEELIVELSSIVTLLPGDLIFTGTPGGVGASRKPRRYLKAGDVIETSIEGIGTMTNKCVLASELLTIR